MRVICSKMIFRILFSTYSRILESALESILESALKLVLKSDPKYTLESTLESSPSLVQIRNITIL